MRKLTYTVAMPVSDPRPVPAAPKRLDRLDTPCAALAKGGVIRVTQCGTAVGSALPAPMT